MLASWAKCFALLAWHFKSFQRHSRVVISFSATTGFTAATLARTTKVYRGLAIADRGCENSSHGLGTWVAPTPIASLFSELKWFLSKRGMTASGFFPTGAVVVRFAKAPTLVIA